jgi:hypothetical protein
MTAKTRDTESSWVDPDDGPELTEEMIEAAEIAVGGRVIRPARGRLGPDGVLWDASAAPPKKRARR